MIVLSFYLMRNKKLVIKMRPLNSLSKLDGEVTGADVVEEITSVNALRMEVLDSCRM